MKKNILLWMLTAVLTLGLAACGGGASSASTPAASTPADSTPVDSSMVSVPNPLVEYNSIDELNEALGFTVQELPIDGYKVQTYIAIDNTVGQINYSSPDGPALCLRTAKAGGDISGVYGANFAEETIAGVSVHVDAANATPVAWYEKDSMSYSLSGTDIDEVAFRSALEAVVAGA